MSKADIEQRHYEDAERYRLRELDKQDNGSRLYEWTVNNMAGRGRPPSLNQNAKELGDALAFVSVAGTKDIQPWNKHVQLTGGWAIMSDGQVSAGHPIKEELQCNPHMEKLKTALAKCGKSLSITQLDSGRLSIKGDNLRAIVPCLPEADVPEFEWDDPQGPVSDELKEAFKVCGALAKEDGITVIEASLLLQNGTCTGTNRKSMMQYWHGITLPPVDLVVPKIFTNAVCKTSLKLVSMGWNPGHSITLYFENGAWIKTLLYADAWPPIDGILNHPSTPTPILAKMLEAISTVGEFADDGVVLLGNEVVQSHLSIEEGAQFGLVGLEGKGKLISVDQMKVIGPFIETIDTTSYSDRILFFGVNNKMRGAVMCITRSSQE